MIENLQESKQESLWAELTNSSHRVTGATLEGWRVVQEKGKDWIPELVQVEVSLCPGWSGYDHLFDRTVVRIAERLQHEFADHVAETTSQANGRPDFVLTPLSYIPEFGGWENREWKEKYALPAWVEQEVHEKNKEKWEREKRSEIKRKISRVQKMEVIEIPALPDQMPKTTRNGRSTDGLLPVKSPVKYFIGDSEPRLLDNCMHEVVIDGFYDFILVQRYIAEGLSRKSCQFLSSVGICSPPATFNSPEEAEALKSAILEFLRSL